MVKITVCLLLAACAVAVSAYFPVYPKYKFEYAVNDPHTNDFKKQWESRDGDRVSGSYSLIEPDGSHRVVEYQADGHNGFNAIVRREGQSHHPHTSYHGHTMGPSYYR